MGRIIALDYGKVRTGIAITDELQLIASGLTTEPTKELITFLKEYATNEEIDTFVIGEPKQMDNTPSESEILIQGFLKDLKKVFPTMPIVRQDERFTSKMAMQSMIAGGMKKKQRRNKEMVDEISATLILQAYMNKY